DRLKPSTQVGGFFRIYILGTYFGIGWSVGSPEASGPSGPLKAFNASWAFFIYRTGIIQYFSINPIKHP
ncbi:MAG: hypothetical protein ACKVJF_06790, partial [Flavobacteriales bacterium]